MAERGQVSNFSHKNGNHISTMIYNEPQSTILKWSEVMYVTYTSEIFRDPHSKK